MPEGATFQLVALVAATLVIIFHTRLRHSMIFTADMTLVPALLLTYLVLPFRALNPVLVSKNTAVDILLTTTMKRAPVFMPQKRIDPLLDHIVDSEASLEVHRNVSEWDTRNNQLILGKHSFPRDHSPLL